jgi:hypothetical protein
MTHTNPLIETWQDSDSYAGRRQITSRHPTTYEARKARADELGVPVSDVMGRRISE